MKFRGYRGSDYAGSTVIQEDGLSHIGCVKRGTNNL